MSTKKRGNTGKGSRRSSSKTKAKPVSFLGKLIKWGVVAGLWRVAGIQWCQSCMQ